MAALALRNYYFGQKNNIKHKNEFDVLLTVYHYVSQ
jgi:hypothetical protein